MTKWEYKFLIYPERIKSNFSSRKEKPIKTVEAMLNQLGSEGWELVNYGTLDVANPEVPSTCVDVETVFTFKRPL